tara:strand:- start:649 stop:1110 length:462 start_codon:yes stop_codon:yes gene_type:complete
MIKNTFLIFLLFLTSACGFDAMHSKNKSFDNEFSITKINFDGDRTINIKIREILNTYIIENKNRSYNLEIDSKSTKKTIAKDSKGNPSIFNLEIEIVVNIIEKGMSSKIVKFNESYNYDNNNNIFETKRYEKEIKINLTETLIKNLIYRLSNF